MLRWAWASFLEIIINQIRVVRPVPATTWNCQLRIAVSGKAEEEWAWQGRTVLPLHTLSHQPNQVYTFHRIITPFDPPMHYWLRPIERRQFGLQNLTSHFINVQIFQMEISTISLILSASKYFRYICWGRNEHILISLIISLHIDHKAKSSYSIIHIYSLIKPLNKLKGRVEHSWMF